MHIMQMLGIVTLLYFVTLALIALNRDKINVKIGNIIFVIVDIILYVVWMYSCARGDGISLFTLIGNISPLTCVIVAMTPIFSDKIRDMAYCTIAFLHFGIFVAMFISPEHAYLFNFRDQAPREYTAEALCHMICSLFGAYLMLTRQVKPCYESWIKAIKFIYSIITSGVIFNFLMHERLFGMDPYGKYSIYMIDIFGSFEATLAAYYLGVLVVLTLGLQVGHLLNKIAPSHHHVKSEETAVERTDGETDEGSSAETEYVSDEGDNTLNESEA